MADSALGSTSLTKKKKTDVNKCVICQQAKKKNEITLSTTPDGIKKIIDASNVLKDGLLDGLTENEKQNIRYHRLNCYCPYVLKASRTSKEKQQESQSESSTSTCMQVSNSDISTRTTRSSTMVSPPENANTVCVICNHVKHKGVTSLHRIAEHSRASIFLAAYQFNKDDVYRRCIFLKTTGDIYAADIMYHTNCMSAYLLQFDRDLSRINGICNEMDPECTELLTSAVDELCSSLELSSKGYTLSECRDLINTKFETSGVKALITNRHLKQLLIKKIW